MYGNQGSSRRPLDQYGVRNNYSMQDNQGNRLDMNDALHQSNSMNMYGRKYNPPSEIGLAGRTLDVYQREPISFQNRTHTHSRSIETVLSQPPQRNVTLASLPQAQQPQTQINNYVAPVSTPASLTINELKELTRLRLTQKPGAVAANTDASAVPALSHDVILASAKQYSHHIAQQQRLAQNEKQKQEKAAMPPAMARFVEEQQMQQDLRNYRPQPNNSPPYNHSIMSPVAGHDGHGYHNSTPVQAQGQGPLRGSMSTSTPAVPPAATPSNSSTSMMFGKAFVEGVDNMLSPLSRTAALLPRLNPSTPKDRAAPYVINDVSKSEKSGLPVAIDQRGAGVSSNYLAPITRMANKIGQVLHMGNKPAPNTALVGPPGQQSYAGHEEARYRQSSHNHYDDYYADYDEDDSYGHDPDDDDDAAHIDEPGAQYATLSMLSSKNSTGNTGGMNSLHGGSDPSQRGGGHPPVRVIGAPAIAADLLQEESAEMKIIRFKHQQAELLRKQELEQQMLMQQQQLQQQQLIQQQQLMMIQEQQLKKQMQAQQQQQFLQQQQQQQALQQAQQQLQQQQMLQQQQQQQQQQYQHHQGLQTSLASSSSRPLVITPGLSADSQELDFSRKVIGAPPGLSTSAMPFKPSSAVPGAAAVSAMGLNMSLLSLAAPIGSSSSLSPILSTVTSPAVSARPSAASGNHIAAGAAAAAVVVGQSPTGGMRESFETISSMISQEVPDSDLHKQAVYNVINTVPPFCHSHSTVLKCESPSPRDSDLQDDKETEKIIGEKIVIVETKKKKAMQRGMSYDSYSKQKNASSDSADVSFELGQDLAEEMAESVFRLQDCDDEHEHDEEEAEVQLQSVGALNSSCDESPQAKVPTLSLGQLHTGLYQEQQQQAQPNFGLYSCFPDSQHHLQAHNSHSHSHLLGVQMTAGMDCDCLEESHEITNTSGYYQRDLSFGVDDDEDL